MKKKKKKKLEKQEKTLLLSIVVLIIAIILLSIYAVNLKSITAKKTSNITIPILEEKTENILSIDISNMKKSEVKEYIFKVTNFRKNNIIDKNINYKIEINNSENLTLKMYKNSDFERNIISNTNVIEENKLEKSKKITDEYHLVIKVKNTPQKDEKITIKITS